MAASQYAGPSLEDILSHHGLEKKDLQRQCPQGVRITIATKLVDWKTTGHYFGVPPEKVAAIDREHATEDQRRIALLDCWEEREGRSASCLKLADVLHRCERADLVELLCREIALGKNESVSSDETPLQSCTSEAEVQSAHVVDKPRLTFPMLEQVVEISEEEKERLKQRLYSESVDMMYKFQKLFAATIKSLKERKVTVKDLLNHIGCFVAIEPVYQDSKLGQLRYELPKAKTIDDVMSIVREYSSFFNYEMLKNIIDHLGGEEDRKNLAAYLQEFTEYARRKVYECPREVGQISEAGRSNVLVILDKSYDNCTVSSLKKFERNLAKILNVSSEMVVLCRQI